MVRPQFLSLRNVVCAFITIISNVGSIVILAFYPATCFLLYENDAVQFHYDLCH